MCIFFLCLCTAFVEIILQYQTSDLVSDGKVNIIRWYIIEFKSNHFPTVFKKIEKNKKKVTEKREFLRKIGFRPNRIFIWLRLKN
ncbi:Uncharacterized protein FWK35_00023947 [Aphis craccivora]|uniref:Uncharacterized protein n=1 Tax=Aphis craccivora TaxID=307492 RepID=A0A6G0YQ44_APHCR|nr:Uncharacterized protein FWK35_00023947 [Aphis craccivora]